MNFDKNFKRLKGDASLRIFFRNKKESSSSIIVYANKNNLSLPQFKTLLLKNIEFSCTINIKK